MTSNTSPDTMKPSERIDELATLFARGVRRIRARPTVAISDSGKTAESTRHGLALPGKSRLSSDHGLTVSRVAAGG